MGCSFLVLVLFIHYIAISHVLWVILQVFLAKLKIVKVTKSRVTLLEDQLALLIKLFHIGTRITEIFNISNK
jgi:hypothetical protein